MTPPTAPHRAGWVMKVAALVTVALAAVIVWRQNSGAPANFRPSDAVGAVLADQVARLGDGAGKLVVIARAADKGVETARGRQISAFEIALRRHAGLQLVATEWLPPEPAGMMAGGGVTADQLIALIEKHSETKVFVIFAGLPPFSPGLASRLRARPVTVAAVCGYGPNVRSWLEAKALAAAVVPRLTELPSGSPPPRSPTDWFQREFEIVTPDNVARLPY